MQSEVHFLSEHDPDRIAKNAGLSIPVVYNTNAYESVETIRAYEGLVDVYLPDLKYVDPRLSLKFSHAMTRTKPG